MKRAFFLLTAIVLTIAPALPGATGDGRWLRKVPQNARTRVNPMSDDVDAPAAGAKLFRQDCASCHGADRLGKGSRPSLLSDRVRDATDGELEWLLKNGSMKQGMPSWSKLPETERWQIVRFLHTMPTGEQH